MFDTNQRPCQCVYMDNIITKIKRFANQVAGLFPSPVPVGMEDFETWAASIQATYPLEVDADSVKFALASMILHSGPRDAYKSKFSFFLMLRSGMAKQVAGAVFQDIKTKQQARIAAEQAEATAKEQVASDVRSV